MNQNLLYLVARHNVDRIYGDGRFDWIEDTWVRAVVAIGKKLPGRREVPTESKTTMAAMAARTRGRRTK